MTDAEADDLRTARGNYVRQLVELSDPCRRKPTYSIGGRSVSWESYQRMLLDLVKALDETLGESPGVTTDSDWIGYILTATE